jgi:formylglycine-generating enzyme required for sulfatase activity
MKLYSYVRGGSWNFDAEFCRVAYRYRSSPVNRNYSVGFRIIKLIKNK